MTTQSLQQNNIDYLNCDNSEISGSQFCPQTKSCYTVS